MTTMTTPRATTTISDGQDFMIAEIGGKEDEKEGEDSDAISNLLSGVFPASRDSADEFLSSLTSMLKQPPPPPFSLLPTASPFLPTPSSLLPTPSSIRPTTNFPSSINIDASDLNFPGFNAARGGDDDEDDDGLQYAALQQYNNNDGDDDNDDGDGDDDDEKKKHDASMTTRVGGGCAEAVALTHVSSLRGGGSGGEEVDGRENESFQIWEQSLNQARAACAAWKVEAEEAKTIAEEKEKEKEKEKREKEMALITCEQLSAKISILRSFDEAKTPSSSSPTSEATNAPPAAAPAAASTKGCAAASARSKRSKEFWLFLCEMEEESLLIDGLSLDKLMEMKRILGRCIKNVEQVIKNQNAVLKKIWDGEN